ncbi:hypothetical protein PAMP_021166 [Pampus punctatissimus]
MGVGPQSCEHKSTWTCPLSPLRTRYPVPRNHDRNTVLGIDFDIELGNTADEAKDDPVHSSHLLCSEESRVKAGDSRTSQSSEQKKKPQNPAEQKGFLELHR